MLRNLFLFFIFSSAVFSATAQETAYVPGEMIIMLERGAKPDVIERSFGQTRNGNTGLKHTEILSRNANVHLFSFNEGGGTGEALLRNVRQNKYVLAAQFNHYVQERATVPNDPLLGQQWHHVNSNDADIDSDLAWDITTGGTTANGDEIVVCVIEPSGANYNHPDLIDNHWTNGEEIPGNGIDDDGNGYVDDYNGWRPGSNSDNINSGNHGTAVSGMIGAVGNDNSGGVGVNWDVKIMQVQLGSLTESNVILAYDYPLTMRTIYNDSQGASGAFVVATNASWGIDYGDPANYPVWCNFYDVLGEEGILNCGATSNSNINIDNTGDLPTGCGSDYMVAVTATNSSDQRTFSGYGQNSIDLAAPGGGVYLPSGSSGYSSTSGTSFASPCVAGGIALVYSAPCETLAGLALANPQAAADAVRGYIFDGVDQISQLQTETVTGGRLNVFNALNLALDNCGPPPTCDAGGISLTTECLLNPDNDNVEAAVSVGAQFDGVICTATQVCYRIGSSAPVCIDIQSAGGELSNAQDFTVEGLQSSTTYTFYYTTSGGTSPEQTITTPDCASETAGCTDPAATNFNSNATIENGSCIFPCNEVSLTINTDCWGGEVSWEILDENGNEVAGVSTGTYDNQETYVWSECLDYGCYTFNIFDSFGDGMNGEAYSSCGVNGNYEIVNNQTGESLVVMTAADADYGSGETHTFCLEAPEPEVPPCELPYPSVEGLNIEVVANGAQLTWDPILGSLGCQIQGGRANSSGLQSVDEIQTELESFFVPASQLVVNNELYRIRVRCGCSRNPNVIGGWSDWAYFFWAGSSSNFESQREQRFLGDDHFELDLQPNPSSGDVLLQLDAGTEDVVHVRIYDLVGKLVYSSREQTVAGVNQYRLSLSHLEPAVYLVRLESTEGKSVTAKMVISK